MSLDLAQVPFFRDMGQQTRDDLMGIGELHDVGARTTVFSAGDPVDHAYLLLEGKVKLTRPSLQQPPPLPPLRGRVTAKEMRRRAAAQHVRESLLWLMGPGEMFGELSIFDGGERSTSATTQTPARLLAMPSAALLERVENNPEVAAAMLRQLAHRLRRSDDQTAGFVLSDVPGRLAHLLLSLGERFGEPDERGGLRVVHDLTQAEIARVVGASRESVNKALSDFEHRGLVSVRNGTVVLHNIDKLRARTA